MTNTTASKAYTAARAFFEEHAAAVSESADLKRQADSIGQKLEKQADAAKPNFSAISTLHFERQYASDKLLRATNTIARLEGEYEKAGNGIYHEVNRMRALAGQAAVECVRSRLRDDFTGEALDYVTRWHPVTIAEDQRDSYVPTPREAGGFVNYAKCVPELMNQVELCRQRIRIYEQCAEARTLPNQKELNALTPESAKPVVITKRRELTPDEEREHERSLMSEETRHLHDLYQQGKRIAGNFGENIEELNTFVRKHPEIARFFSQKRLAS